MGEDSKARARPVSHSRQGAEEGRPPMAAGLRVSLPVTDHPVGLEEPWHETFVHVDGPRLGWISWESETGSTVWTSLQYLSSFEGGSFECSCCFFFF